MPLGQVFVGERETVDRNTFPECVLHNVRATTRDNTGQNTHKGHTQFQEKIKIPDPTDHAMGTYFLKLLLKNLNVLLQNVLAMKH